MITFFKYIIFFIDFLVLYIPKSIRVQMWSYLFFGSKASYVLSVFANETGNFKSDLFLKYNNPSGMGVPSKYGAYSSTIELPEGKKSVYLSVGVGVFDWFLYSNYRVPSVRRVLNSSDSLQIFIHHLKNFSYFASSEEQYYNNVLFYFDKYYSKQPLWLYLFILLLPFSEILLIFYLIKRILYAKRYGKK